MTEDREQVGGTLEVCSDGVFRARLTSCDERTWCGLTSRSAKVRLVRAVSAERGCRTDVRWSYRFPSEMAQQLSEFRQWSVGRGRREVSSERLRLADLLVRVHRLTVAEAASNLGINPGSLGQSLRAGVRG